MPSAVFSDFNAFSDAQRIFGFDTEVSNRAVHFGMPEQELNRTQVTGLRVDQSGLSAPQGMCPIPRRIETCGRHPLTDEPSVLPRR